MVFALAKLKLSRACCAGSSEPGDPGGATAWPPDINVVPPCALVGGVTGSWDAGAWPGAWSAVTGASDPPAGTFDGGRVGAIGNPGCGTFPVPGVGIEL